MTLSLQENITRLNEIGDAVQVDQLRSASWEQRGSWFICKAPASVLDEDLRGFSLTACLVDIACDAVAIGKRRWLANETPKYVALIKGDGRVVLGVGPSGYVPSSRLQY